MEEEFQKFRSKILKLAGPRKARITNSWGVYDYYKYYIKHRPKEHKYALSESQYFSIIRRINQKLVEELLRTGTIYLPNRMGTIEIRKRTYSPRIDSDGKVILHAPIDWQKTLRLWYEDEESLQNKTLIKVESREVFRTVYRKAKAVFQNKAFYFFRLNKYAAISMKQSIKTGNFDAFDLIQSYNE